MEVGSLAVNQYAVSLMNMVFLSTIIEDAAAFFHVEKQIGHQVLPLADMGLPCLQTPGFLQVKKVGPCKFRGGIEDAVGTDKFSLK